MRKLTLFFLVLALSLAACGQLTPPTSSSEESGQPSPSTPTALPAAATIGAATGPAECRLVGKTEPNPTIEAILPRVAEKDWVKGPDGASITITEYSDFQ